MYYYQHEKLGLKDGVAYLFKMFFFPGGEVQHLIGVLDEHSSFRLSLRNVERRGENGYFCASDFFYLA